MKEELNGLANHIASAKGGLPQEWQDWAEEIEADIRKLANREAQPVMFASEETLAYAKEGEKSVVTWSEPMGDAVIPLFTVPPAPANAVAWEMRYWNSGHNMWGDWERITAEQHAEMSVKFATDNDYEFRVLYDAPPSPAVPDGFKLMPLEMTDEIGEAIAMEARCCGGIALCIYESALAAAPEGGNDHDTRR
ncbi:TPA: hypothetical protein ACKP8U_001502 [Serratia marcescens]|uniref:hypothetical protein n=1 Tax=Serratia marcescens TaxID=615 RepID=UPI002FE59112